MQMVCLIKNKLVDPDTLVLDQNTGGKVIHYVGHWGKLKTLRTLIEEFGVDVCSLDNY